MQETSKIHTPYALEHFMNRTIVDTHTHLLKNLRLVLEGEDDEFLEGREKTDDDWDFDEDIDF